MRSRPKVFPSSIRCQPSHGPTDDVRQRGWTATSFNATRSGLYQEPGLLLFTTDLPVVSFYSDGSALTPPKGGPSDSPKGVSSQNLLCPDGFSSATSSFSGRSTNSNLGGYSRD